jgi:hypothetical protein
VRYVLNGLFLEIFFFFFFYRLFEWCLVLNAYLLFSIDLDLEKSYADGNIVRSLPPKAIHLIRQDFRCIVVAKYCWNRLPQPIVWVSLLKHSRLLSLPSDTNSLRWDVLDTTLCDKVCQWLGTGQWFSPGTPVSSTNKTDHHDIAKILLKVALSTIKPTKY